MKIYTIDEILKKMLICVAKDKPFSHIRLGDGGIKLIHAYLYNKYELLEQIIEKEGLPKTGLDYILKLWIRYINQADFIDTPEVYYTDEFWPRVRSLHSGISKQTIQKLLDWEELYNEVGFTNKNYCNPESNYLMILKRPLNLLSLMNGRKFCIITARNDLKEKMRKEGFDVDIVKIVGQYDYHYTKSFSYVIDEIQRNVKKYDFWLVAAGELGRIYSGLIKECGGRSLDIGFVADFWAGKELHPRLSSFLVKINKFELILTSNGRRYEEYI